MKHLKLYVKFYVTDSYRGSFNEKISKQIIYQHTHIYRNIHFYH